MNVKLLVAQSCPTLCDPMDWGFPGPYVMGFSRQEYWSGLPCPSPRVKSNWGEFQESSFSEDIHVNVIRVIKLHMLRKTTHTHIHIHTHTPIGVFHN